MSAAAPPELDLRLKLAQIDQALASHDMMRVQSDTLRIQQDQLRADADRKRQEMRFAPWLIVTSSMGTGAALFAAAFAFARLFQ
jgi:hypothetical protein